MGRAQWFKAAFVFCVFVPWVISACDESSGDAGVCEPGDQKSCACPGGDAGAQVCLDDGSGWGPCQGCGGNGGTGGNETGGMGGSAGGTGGTGGATGGTSGSSGGTGGATGGTAGSTGGTGGGLDYVGLYQTTYGSNDGQGMWATDVHVTSTDAVFSGAAHDCNDSTYCRDAVLLQMSHTGEPGWIARFDNSYSAFAAVTRDSVGNVYAAGSTGTDAFNLYVTMVSAGGVPVWEKTFSHTHANVHHAYDVCVNDDGTVGVLAQLIHSWCSGPCGCISRAVYYYTLDAQTGGILTQQAVGWPGSATFVSDGFIVATEAEDCIQPGNICGILTLKKFDQNGALQWTRGYPSYKETQGGDSTYIYMTQVAISEFSDGYVVAVAPNSTPNFLGLLFQIDKSGAVNWMQVTDVNNSEDKTTTPSALLASPDGSAMLSSTNGFTSVGNVLTRFNADGSLLGSTALGQPGYLNVLAHLSPSTFIGAGKSLNAVVPKMLAGRFPTTLPLGDYCSEVGLSFAAHTPAITPAIFNEGQANSARPACTFAEAEETDVSFYVPSQTVVREEHCEK